MAPRRISKKFTIFLVILTLLQLVALQASPSLASFSYGYGYQFPIEAPQEKDLLINEFVSRPPKGKPEWIELFNPHNTPFDLSTCLLEDLTGSIYQFQAGNQIGPADFVVVELPRTKLNNGGDLIRLQCEEQTIDELRYGNASPTDRPSPAPIGFDQADGFLPAPAQGHSLGRVEDKKGLWFDLSTPSPGEHNQIINEAPQAIIRIQGSGKTEDCDRLSFNVTGEDSTDPDGDQLSFRWKYLTEGALLFETDRENPLSFVFEKSMGEKFRVELTVTDPFGETSNDFSEASLGVCQKTFNDGPPTTDYQPTSSLSIHINEVFPNPVGSDTGNEFIELFNSGKETIHLDGWKLGGKTKKQLDGLVIYPNNFLISKKIILRNAGDTIELMDPLGKPISSIEYPEAIEGKSFSWEKDSIWKWTIPTPLAANDFPFETETIYLQAEAPLIITRFLPNPDGKDDGQEWIEIFNRSEQDIDLSAWQLDNRQGGSAPYILSGKIQPNESKQFFSSETKITLRNTADQVRILSLTGQVVDLLEWKSDAPSGKIFERNQLILDLSAEPELATVIRVVDGDTIDVLVNGVEERVRLIGVDTPETVHPFKPLEYFGKEASAFTKSRLEGKEVRLEYDLAKRGKYGRLLAYVWIGDRHFNAELIKQGYAFAYLNYPFKYREAFRLLEKQARLEGAGMWKSEKIQEIQTQQEEALDEELEEFETIEEILEELEESREETEEEIALQESDQTGWEYIRLNEILPNPAGKDSDGGEFIELINLGPNPVDLSGWSILNNKDQTLFIFENSKNSIIRKFMIIAPSKNLKNSTEQLQLVDLSGKIQDTFSYDQPIKDDQVWSRHPLTQRWQLLGEPTPNKENPSLFLDPSVDQDGISDADEQSFGLDPSSWDSDQDGLPDDFELLKEHQLTSVDYPRYLYDAFQVQFKQTQRTLRFFGTSRPYTSIILTVMPEQQVIEIPVEADGSWLYKVDRGLESGGHRFVFSVKDPNETQSSSERFIDLTLENRLNASKLPKKKKPKKTTAPKPIYRIVEVPKNWIQASFQHITSELLKLENGASIALTNTEHTLALALLSQQNDLTYQSDDTQKFQLVRSAYASSSPSASNSKEPIYTACIMLLLSVIATGVKHLHENCKIA